MVPLVSNSPLSDKQTHLQPVLKPGSKAKTRFSPKGEANKSCCAFKAKTEIASSSARFFSFAMTSFSKLGCNKRSYASSKAYATTSLKSLYPRNSLRFTFRSDFSVSGSAFTLRKPKSRPRITAKKRCEGMPVNF